MMPCHPDNRFIRSLEKKGIDYIVLEARSTLGGRMVTATANCLLTADSAKNSGGFNLGSS